MDSRTPAFGIGPAILGWDLLPAALGHVVGDAQLGRDRVQAPARLQLVPEQALTAVPEPTTFLLAPLAFAPAIFPRKRTRSR